MGFRLILLIACLFCIQEISCQQVFQRNISFDQNWKFFRGGIQDGERISVNDTNWRELDLPHDWSIEDLPGLSTPFDADAISQVGGGFTTGGTAWYRKHFFMEKNVNNQQIEILFEGVYMNADIWINGKHIGSHPNGYSSFWFNVTPFLNFNSANLIAVQVKNEGQNSRWYSGSGIYRHVWLHKTPPVHFKQWGIYAHVVSWQNQRARISVNSRVLDCLNTPDKYLLVTTVFDQQGKKICSKTEDFRCGSDRVFFQEFIIEHPQSWTPEHPNLYHIHSEIYKNSILQDRLNSNIGLREIRIDSVNGLVLNDIPIKLKGACIHQDHGPLGAASFDRAEERRVRLLKENGFNAVRCAHNPPSPAFLDFCDSLGMFVVDEAFDMWNDAKSPYDYHLFFKMQWQNDMEDMILRDRNHPSLVMWSIGNEIQNKQTPLVIQQAQDLVAIIKLLDTGRLVTAAVNEMEPDKDPFFETLDIAGYNYGLRSYLPDHARKAKRIFLGTESYPLEAFDYWTAVEDNSFLVGDFVWTGFDYIGEASIGWRGYPQQKDFYPWNLAYCGDLDVCGRKRPQSYYRDALWKKNQLAIFVKPTVPTFPLNPLKEDWSKWNWEDVVADWNWNETTDTAMEVKVYSSCAEVELLLNGKALGRKLTNRSTRYLANWKIKFEPGSLMAIGYTAGKKVNQQSLVTTGPAFKIKLTPETKEIISGGQDLCYVNVEILDANDHLLPAYNEEITFSISGPGVIAGVGNGNPVSIESFQKNYRSTWRGRCLAIIKSTPQKGLITIKASGRKLSPVSINIISK